MQHEREITPEKNILSAIMNNGEATMNQVASNSIALVILKLRDHYLGKDPSEKQLDELYETVIRKLENLKSSDFFKKDDLMLKHHQVLALEIEKEWPSLLIFIKAVIEENLTWLDRVTIYTLGDDGIYGETCVDLPLRTVLPLVFIALIDNAKFMHHYEGSIQEKQRKAGEDRPIRFLSLFRCFQRIKKGICHQGARHELVLLLNHVYQGIEIIEDPSACATYLLKEKVHTQFSHYLTVVHKKEDKMALGHALLMWITEYNASQLCELIDPGHSINRSICQYFLEHGSNPEQLKLKYGTEEVSLDSFIDKMKTTLDFSPDVTKDPLLCMIKRLLQEEPPGTHPTQKDLALLKIQDWIKTVFIIDLKKKNQTISDFYVIYEGSQRLYDYQTLLRLTNKEVPPAVAEYEASFECYYDDIGNTQEIVFPRASIEALQSVRQLGQWNRVLKKDNLVDEISNFFSFWFMAASDKDIRTLKRQYAFLLNKHFQEKVIWDDVGLQDCQIKNTTLEGQKQVFKITPYEINRIFLHAILVDPKDWSDLFEQILTVCFDFIKDPQSDFLSNGLKKSSYLFPLMQQIMYLQELRAYFKDKTGTVSEPIRCSGPFLLPEHVTTAEEWFVVSALLDTDHHERCYHAISWRLNPMLLSYLNDELTEIYEFYTFMSALPESVYESFFSKVDMDGLFKILVENCEYDADCRSCLLLFIAVIPIENIIEFIKNNQIESKIFHRWRFAMSEFHPVAQSWIEEEKEALNILWKNEEKKKIFFRDVYPNIEGDSIFNMKKVLDFSERMSYFKDDYALTCYMIKGNIDTKEYLEKYQALNPFAQGLLKQIVSMVSEESFLMKRDSSGFKVMYDQFYQIASFISQGKDQRKGFDESDDESTWIAGKLSINSYTVAVFILLYSNLLLEKRISQLEQHHWDFFTIMMSFFVKGLPCKNDEEFLDYLVSHQELMDSILKIVITDIKEGFSIKECSDFINTITKINNTIAPIDCIEYFIQYQALDQYGQILFDDLASSGYFALNEDFKINYSSFFEAIRVLSECEYHLDWDNTLIQLLLSTGLLSKDNLKKVMGYEEDLRHSISIFLLVKRAECKDDSKFSFLWSQPSYRDAVSLLLNSELISDSNFLGNRANTYYDAIQYMSSCLKMDIHTIHFRSFFLECYHAYDPNQDQIHEQYKIVLKVLSIHRQAITVSSFKKLLDALPSELNGLFFQTIGLDRIKELMQEVYFSDLLAIFEKSALKDMKILCSALPHTMFLELRYVLSEFEIEDKLFYSKAKLEEIFISLGKEKKEVIIEYIASVADESMIKFVKHDPRLGLSDEKRLLKAYMMDAKIDTQVYWLQYQGLNYYHAGRLEKLIAEFSKREDDLGDLKRIYKCAFEMVSNLHPHGFVGVPQLVSVVLKQLNNLPSERTETQIGFFQGLPEYEQNIVIPAQAGIGEDNPGNSGRVFDRVCSKLEAYLVLFVGWCINLVTFGQIGYEWIEWANETLREIDEMETPAWRF